jgi:hypothetical protein
MARIKNSKTDSLVGRNQQTCKVCGCQDRFNFHVPDELWKSIVPLEFQNRVVCLPCFDQFAFEKQIDYSDSLELLYFAGDMAAFKFETVAAASV